IAVELWKGVRLVPSDPLRSGEGQPRVGKAGRPPQRQARRCSFALQHDVRRSGPWTCRNPTGRNVRVSLEGQLDDVEPNPLEDRGPLLADVTERAEKVVPVQRRSCSSPHRRLSMLSRHEHTVRSDPSPLNRTLRQWELLDSSSRTQGGPKAVAG